MLPLSNSSMMDQSRGCLRCCRLDCRLGEPAGCDADAAARRSGCALRWCMRLSVGGAGEEEGAGDEQLADAAHAAARSSGQRGLRQERSQATAPNSRHDSRAERGRVRASAALERAARAFALLSSRCVAAA